MTMKPEQQQAIIAKESAWIDDGFGQIDLSQFPHLQPAPTESRDDGRFARDWRDTPLNTSAAALRKFVSDPDAEALDRAGSETNNPEFRAEARDQKGELVAQAFKRACPRYMSTSRNYGIMLDTLSFNALGAAEQQQDDEARLTMLIDRGYWTTENLLATFRALDEEGLLDIEAGTTRNLSSAERLRVSRLAQSGRVDLALAEYLRYTLDDEQVTLDMINDPVYRPACDAAVWSVFRDITFDYVPTPEREAYIQRHCAGRPLTLALLQSAWAACQANEQRNERSELLNPIRERDQPPSEYELDELNDDQVNRLYQQTRRARADQFRQGPGILA